MALILQIDSSDRKGGVSLSRDGQLLDALQYDTQDHAGSLAGYIGELLNRNEFRFEDLSAVCVCSGPGSYTGLRIGMALAKGYCYALNIPLISISRLELMAWASRTQSPGQPIAAVLQARPGEQFVAAYDGSFSTVCHPQHISSDDLESLLRKADCRAVVISLDNELHPSLLSAFNLIDFTVLDHEAWALRSEEYFRDKRFADLAYSVPSYLKEVFILQKK